MSVPRSLLRLLAFYGTMFCAYGVASPFLPGLLQQRGVTPAWLGVILAAGTATRLVAGPLGGRLADRSGRAPLVLAGFTGAAALVALGYGPASGVLPLMLVGIAHAAVLAPISPVADALALGSASARPGFAYGWVRGAGSAAFIVGTLVAGQLVGPAGLGVIVWLNAGFLAAAALSAVRVPNRVAGTTAAPAASGGWRQLLTIPGFTTLMAVAALVGGSHALHDGFEVIRWRAAGLSAGECSVLWSLSVAAEVVVFVLVGGPLLARLGAARSLALAAVAGVLRWSAAALTASFWVMAAVEPLHGLTFALLHLACMGFIARSVPSTLAATAQAFYGTVAVGAAFAAMSLASGPLYGAMGAAAFWVMAGACAGAIPFATTLRERRSPAVRQDETRTSHSWP